MIQNGFTGEISRPGISKEFLRRHNIRHVNEDEAEVLVGFKASGLIIPYPGVLNSELLVTGKQFCRLRLDRPTSSAKYISPRGSGCQIYIPQGAPFKIELVICEGEFKALALCESGIRAVGIGGINSALPAGKLHPDLKKIIDRYNPHKIHYVGDADTCFIFAFAREATKLARTLPGDCHLSLPRIPLQMPNGIDDWKENLGDQFVSFWENIVHDSVPVSKQDTPQTIARLIVARELTQIAHAANRDHLIDRLITLASHLDPVNLEILGKEVKSILDVATNAFRSAAKQRAQTRKKENTQEKESDQKDAPTRDSSQLGIMMLPADGRVSNSESANSIFQQIAKQQPPTMFIRGGSVSSIDTSADDEAVAEKQLVICDVSPEGFRSRVEKYGTIFAWRKGPHGEHLLRPNACMSADTAKMLLASDPRLILPKLSVIHRCPLLIQSDGELKVLGVGYHSILGGRYILDGEVHQMQLEEAVELILSLFEEYLFVSPSDKSRAVAAMISPNMRFGGLLHCHFPAFLFEADKSQAGKGTMAESIQRMHGESATMTAQRKGGVGGFDEELSNQLLAGRPFIQIDNVRSLLDSEFFEMCMTCPPGATVPARIPYKRSVQVDPNQHIFHVTSNHFAATKDLAARSCVIRILKREGFKWKKFPEGNLLEHLRANPWPYLSATFTIVSYWIANGKPRNEEECRGEGRFRTWWQTLDWFVQNIFKLQPLLENHQEIQQRMSSPVFSWLRNMGHYLKTQGLLAVELSTSRLVELANDSPDGAGLAIPGIRENTNDEQKAKRLGVLLASLFSPLKSDSSACPDLFGPGEKPLGADNPFVIKVDSFSVERIERLQTREDSRTYTGKFYIFRV
jgi:hypothetical protein